MASVWGEHRIKGVRTHWIVDIRFGLASYLQCCCGWETEEVLDETVYQDHRVAMGCKRVSPVIGMLAVAEEPVVRGQSGLVDQTISDFANRAGQKAFDPSVPLSGFRVPMNNS